MPNQIFCNRVDRQLIGSKLNREHFEYDQASSMAVTGTNKFRARDISLQAEVAWQEQSQFRHIGDQQKNCKDHDVEGQ
ncbi:hypothetical protein D3C80_821190 [compost metagenome]